MIKILGKDARFIVKCPYFGCQVLCTAKFAFSPLNEDVLKCYDLQEQALATRYREQKTLASYLAELESRKLGQKEKLAEYASDIKGLALKSFPTADSNTRETINLRLFLKGLGCRRGDERHQNNRGSKTRV